MGILVNRRKREGKCLNKGEEMEAKNDIKSSTIF